MANVRVEQRNAHLATAVRLETVAGREGDVSKATLTAISNSKRGSGGEEEPTAIQWTLWGRQAENAAQYLCKGSHVNVAGRLRNNHYVDGKGNTVFGFSFTVEEIDYLESRTAAEGRRAREGAHAGEGVTPTASPTSPGAKGRNRARKAPKAAPASDGKAYGDDDVPF